MTDQELEQSFDYCQTHDDPDAWVALAMAYLQRGYVLNANYCLEQAEAVHQMVTP